MDVLEKLKETIEQAAAQAANRAVDAKLKEAQDTRTAAENALAAAREADGQIRSALALVETLNVTTEQHLVAQADVMATTAWDQPMLNSVMDTRDAVCQALNQHSLHVVKNRLRDDDSLPPGRYGIVICFYRLGPKEA